MWVFCCGMNRSGSTWQYMLASALVEAAGAGRGIGFARPKRLRSLLAGEPVPNEIRVVKCHDYVPEAGRLLEQCRARALYIHRDMRDVVVSYMNAAGVSFWSMLARGFLERCISNDAAWTASNYAAAGSLLISQYDAAQAGACDEARRIAEILGLRLDDHAIENCVHGCSLEHNRKMLRDRERSSSVDAKSIGYAHDQILHTKHINNGGTGQWRGKLSSFQLAVIEHVSRGWFPLREYEFSTSAARRFQAGTVTLPFRKAVQPVARAVEEFILRDRDTVAEEASPKVQRTAA